MYDSRSGRHLFVSVWFCNIVFRHVGLSSLFGWASDHGEPRSAWWSAEILRFFVSVCLAGVMGSVCCWLALVRPSRCVRFFRFLVLVLRADVL